MPTVRVYYHTDPACPWSWALEPPLRRLLRTFGSSLQVRYVMGGFAREFGDPPSMLADVLEAGFSSGMPVDPRLWLGAGPRSSFPACLAVKAVSEQTDPAPYLRRLREGFMCRRRKLDTTDALIDEARPLQGVDLERLRIDLASHAILESFGAELEAGKAHPLPWLRFAGEEGHESVVSGRGGYDELRDAALAAGASATGRPPDVLEALTMFGTMATAELAAVCELPGPRAPAELWRLAGEWAVRAERCGSGELWSLS